MKRDPSRSGPTIAQNPAHAAVVASFQKLSQHDIEAFLYRLTRSHVATLFVRIVLHWFLPSKKDTERPRTDFFRGGFYWFGCTQKVWLEVHELSRRSLETAYNHSADLVIRDHFMFENFRTSFYRVDFERLRVLVESDRKVQARLNGGADARLQRAQIDERGPDAFSRNTRKEGKKFPSTDAVHTAYPGTAQP